MARKADRTRTSEAPRELELKLACAAEEARRVPFLPVLADAEPTSSAVSHLDATYFDTPDQSLRQAGLSVRLRRNGSETVQTIKAESGARGLVLDRDEWEVPVKGDGLDFKAAAKTALKPFLDGGRDLIRPAFTVETERTALVLSRNGATLEVAADEAVVRGGGREERFGEIELELKDGDPRAIFGLARDLVEAAPLRLSLATKSERGYALLDREPPQAVKAERVKVRRRATSAEAFQAIARSCLAQTVRNEAIVRETREPLALHQMRVGLRRLRAAASLFADLLGDQESAAIRAELRWMNHALGPVRDLDVLVRRMREVPQSDRERGHAKALAAAERRRQEAYEHVLMLLDEVRFRGAILAAAAWIENGAWLAEEDKDRRRARDERVTKRAAHELARRRKKVLARAKRLADLDPEARHRVRIEIKKLRYGVEFFGRLFGGGKAKRRRQGTLKDLEALQEVLGELNDIAMGGHILAPAPAAGEARHDCRTKSLLDEADALTRDFANVKPFWR